MAQEILVTPPQLRSMAQTLNERASRIRSALESVDKMISGLPEVKFSGQRAVTLTSRYRMSRSTIFNAPRVVTSFAASLEHAAAVFEKADSTNFSDSSNKGTIFDFPDWAMQALGVLGTIGMLEKFVISPALLLSAIKSGSAYTGQLIVTGSEWFKFWMLGLNPKFTHGSAEALLEGGSQFGKSGGAMLASKVVGGALIAVSLIADWVQDFDKYKDQGTGHVVSAFIYDALKTGTVIGGAKVGAAIGTAINPGLGTVIGAIGGGVVAEVVFGDTIWGLFGQPNPIKEWAIDQMASVGESSGVVPAIDQQIVNMTGAM